MNDPRQQQHPGQTPADYDEYGDEPQRDEPGHEDSGDSSPPKPDEALTDPA